MAILIYTLSIFPRKMTDIELFLQVMVILPYQKEHFYRGENTKIRSTPRRFVPSIFRLPFYKVYQPKNQDSIGLARRQGKKKV